MTYFFRNGNNFNVADHNSVAMHEKLPVGNYIIKKDPMMGTLYLQMIEQFKPISKLYGTTTRDADRIIRTYKSRDVSTGVLLTGEKGSGKTLLAKTISLECAKQEIPTIVINEPFGGEAFNKFMQDISQECVVLFDEFEKVYDSDEQEAILTLLDGVYPTKKLFILTCNDKWRIDSHMRNRPGRIFYSLDFAGLDPSFIVEYCNDNLQNKSETQSVVKVGAMFAQFNFDMLKALVEEMNRYDEPAKASLRMLNAKPEFGGESEFSIEVRENGELINPAWIHHPKQWEGNPLNFEQMDIHIHFPKKVKKKAEPSELDDDVPLYAADVEDEDDDTTYVRLRIRGDELIAMFPQDGRFVFKQGKYEVTLTRIVKSQFFHWDAL